MSASTIVTVHLTKLVYPGNVEIHASQPLVALEACARLILILLFAIVPLDYKEIQ